jgi:threonine dehydrogenase-like Zn-dependent dehydrogenase
MLALTVIPGQRESARLEELPESPAAAGGVLLEAVALGLCGTDAEILEGAYGAPPAGHERLILGHESLAKVLEAPANCGLSPGDLVAPIVRRPDPVPCASCAVGEWDMCLNGLYTECGIKKRDGFCAERFRVDPQFAVKLDPALEEVGVLVEPASVLAKAWEHIERIGSRSVWRPRRVLVTGAGPVGLMAALLAVQRGYEVDVLDRVTEGPKPDLVRDLGARYHTTSVEAVCRPRKPDIVIECTGAASIVFDAIEHSGTCGIVCLTGISSGGRMLKIDAGLLNRLLVLENDVVFGSVNANRRHYEAAAEALARADRGWLARLVTRRLPLSRWSEAIQRPSGDVKTVLDFTL